MMSLHKCHLSYLGSHIRVIRQHTYDTEGNVNEGYSRWYMIQEWFKGTAKGLLKGKVDGFADHGMGNYHGHCEKESKKLMWEIDRTRWRQIVCGYIQHS